MKLFVINVTEIFLANDVSKIILKTEQNIYKNENICALAKKCLKCEQIITGNQVKL